MNTSEVKSRILSVFEKEFIDALVDKKFDEYNIANFIGFTPMAVDFDWCDPRYIEISEELGITKDDIDITTIKKSSTSCEVVIHVNNSNTKRAEIIADLYEDILHTHIISDEIVSAVNDGWFYNADNSCDTIWTYTPSFNISELELKEDSCRFKIEIHVNMIRSALKREYLHEILSTYGEDFAKEWYNVYCR